MSDPQADALRAEWGLLQKEHAELVQKTEALHGSSDGTALREHTARLHAHVERLHLLMAEIEMAEIEEHHKTRGPVRGLVKT